jgi:taurine dioxygenase
VLDCPVRQADHPGSQGGNIMAVTVRAVMQAVGAEISGVDLRHLSDSDFAAIERAWTDHSMILLRGQQLGDDDLLAFSRRFGTLDPPPNQERGRISPPGYPDIYVVSNVLDAKGDPIGALGAGEAAWHTDMSYLDTPPDASMLYSLEIPPRGGNTWFCGMQAACAALPADLRRRIEGRRVKHDGTYNSGGYLRKGVTPTDDPLAAPGAWHPAILRHPANDRATLYLGRRRNSYVEGYSRDESDALLAELWAHTIQPRFVYQHIWKLGDLVVWDNRSTMHRRDEFEGTARRIMHRTQIKGTMKPVAFAA